MKRKFLCLLLVLCTICLFTGGAYAVSSEPQLPNVMDTAGLLDQSQVEDLTNMSELVADRYGVGVYIVSVDDYKTIDPSGVYEATYGIYHEYTMGIGEQRNGIMLLLSMAERDYALFCYGEKSEYAFNDFGLDLLEEVFLDNFADNDWYGGFKDYINECDYYLEQAANGKPISESPFPLIIIFSIISLVIAAIVCAIMAGQMKTVRKKTTAGVYSVSGLNLTEQVDQFTHRTESRRKINRSSSSSGYSQSRSGGGGSGRSGKF